MTPWQRKMLSEAVDGATEQNFSPPNDSAQVGYQWGSMVVIHPLVLRELLALTEERTVGKVQS